MVIFTIVFGRLARLPSGRRPYPMMVFGGAAAVVPVLLDPRRGLHRASFQRQPIGKVYFPRIIIPLATVLVVMLRISRSIS